MMPSSRNESFTRTRPESKLEDSGYKYTSGLLDASAKRGRRYTVEAAMGLRHRSIHPN
jgi:hypothetical protein